MSMYIIFVFAKSFDLRTVLSIFAMKKYGSVYESGMSRRGRFVQ